jgi:hypothetical protein
MKPRHAAALALVGWYLMTPPVMGREDGHKPWPPVARWVVVEDFDSLAPCKLARDKMSNAAEQQFRYLRHEFLHGRQDTAELIDEFFDKYSRPLDLLVVKLDGECVASDDPRLKEK